jgi:hypothetical protein
MTWLLPSFVKPSLQTQLFSCQIRGRYYYTVGARNEVPGHILITFYFFVDHNSKLSLRNINTKLSTTRELNILG